MLISEKIDQDFKQALRDKNASVISTLRMVKAAFKNKEIELKPKNKKLDNEEMIEILKKEVKKRKESIKAFEEGGREDLFSKEKQELEIIAKYLPEQLSEEEIKKIIQKIIKPLGELTIKDFGRVMGLVIKEVKGLADGNEVSKLVKEILEKNK